MDGATTTTFHTPPRILIPKLVKSRDGWKTKAHQRKKRLKAARIRIRDLENSRDNWKKRAGDAESQVRELQEQLAQTQHDLATAQGANADLKKRAQPLS
jgi:chromosome segregation ATPase